MKQHYSVIWGINGESIGKQYINCIIVDKYPGTLFELLDLILESIADNNPKARDKNQIAIKSMVRTF